MTPMVMWEYLARCLERRAWSSRLVTATLKVESGRSDHLHVLSCYAPTNAATREKKNEFFDTLQQTLSGIPFD